jgi:hypothetical protein
MPQYLEPGARVSERWSPRRAAKVEVATVHHKLTEDPMTDDRMALVDLLQKSGDGDFLRAVAEAVRQILMEADVEGLIGAAGTSAAPIGSIIATAIASAASTPASARSSCASPSCARGRPFRRVPRAAQDRRESAGHGDPGGLDRRSVDPAR